MKTRQFWSRILAIAGLLAMLVGAVDPLEGSLLVLPGSGLIALGAGVGQSRYRRLLYVAFVLVAIGVGAMFWLSWLGGIGGRSGRSPGWAVAILPYPIGWILGVVGAVLKLAKGS